MPISPSFSPREFFQREVRRAKSELALVTSEYFETVNQVRSLKLREKALRADVMKLGNESRQAIHDLEVTERRLRDPGVERVHSQRLWDSIGVGA